MWRERLAAPEPLSRGDLVGEVGIRKVRGINKKVSYEGGDVLGLFCPDLTQEKFMNRDGSAEMQVRLNSRNGW